ncbi:aspartyl-phosphate phosphatase Spo0E family protein [Massilibacterium senegalense]|uniref:aspartyl-phosphate phosphatase Spo0E family protein n=1 Tax=Massilibacterium senegalense TaxID=1632858 RepID=UPI000784835A|nr:aspartyl-phosphate phosphatase Spo0E family protein [Massilibacterium senegalense]
MNSIVNAIERKREEMIHLAQDIGLSAIETVQCSQELDHLLNLYQHDKFTKQPFHQTRRIR